MTYDWALSVRIMLPFQELFFPSSKSYGIPTRSWCSSIDLYTSVLQVFTNYIEKKIMNLPLVACTARESLNLYTEIVHIQIQISTYVNNIS